MGHNFMYFIDKKQRVGFVLKQAAFEFIVTKLGQLGFFGLKMLKLWL
jgi:hypothetical protein